MKFLTVASLLLLPTFGFSQIDLSGTIDDKANEKTGDAIDKVWEAPGKLLEKKKEKKENAEKADSAKAATSTPATTPGNTTATAKTNTPLTGIAAYQNYDFVTGSDLIFEDQFTTDEEGEFPAHWKLNSGQGLTNKIENKTSFVLTQGNYAKVKPKTTTENYFGNAFTVETDYFVADGNEDLDLFFSAGITQQMTISIKLNSAACAFPGSPGISADYPSGFGGENFRNKWHHIAVSYKDKAVKVYVDQNRILLVPDCNCMPQSVEFGGIATNENPIVFTNVRLANGGKFNMLDKLNTDGKILSYGISFDANKSSLQPESMGTINQLYKMLNENPDLKLEIDGYTDSDGNDEANLQLSEDRANAVRDQLVKMGIDGSRLSAKGFGETKPLADNATFEGKAKNRRMEILKKK